MTVLKRLAEEANKGFRFYLISPYAPVRMCLMRDDKIVELFPQALIARSVGEEGLVSEFEGVVRMFLEHQPEGATLAWRDEPKQWEEDGAWFMAQDVIVVPPQDE